MHALAISRCRAAKPEHMHVTYLALTTDYSEAHAQAYAATWARKNNAINLEIASPHIVSNRAGNAPARPLPKHNSAYP